MLVIDDLSLRIAGRLLLDQASASCRRRPRRAGRPQRHRQDDAVPRDRGRYRGRARHRRLPARARIGRLAQEAPDGPRA